MRCRRWLYKQASKQYNKSETSMTWSAFVCVLSEKVSRTSSSQWLISPETAGAFGDRTCSDEVSASTYSLLAVLGTLVPGLLIGDPNRL